MVFKLTNDSLAKMDNLPLAIYNSQKYPEVIAVKDYTVDTVDKLLKEERIKYIFTKEGERVDVKDGEYAFDFFKRFILCDNGDEIEIGGSEKVILEGNYITHEGVSYENAKINRREYVGIVSSELVTESKPKGEDEYHKVDKQTHREYVYDDYISDENTYESAKITDMSLMEITSLSGLNTRDEQLAFLGNYFENGEIDLQTISRLYSQAINIFKHRSTFLSKSSSFRGFEGKNFQSEKDILSFLNNSSDKTKKRRDRTIYCTLLKYIYLLNEYEKSPIYQLLSELETGGEEKKVNFIRKMYNLSDDVNISRDARGIYIFSKEVGGTEVIITFRIKSIDSIINKSLSRGEYLKIENFHDLFGASYYIPEIDSAKNIDVMKKVDEEFLSNNGYLDNKGFIDNSMLKNLSGEGIEKKYSKSLNNKGRSSRGDANYVDAKFIGKYSLMYQGKNIEVGHEAKFYNGTPEGDVNEEGMVFHPVYEYFSKYFQAETNRQPFITAENLADRIQELYDFLGNDNLEGKYQKQRIDVLREIYNELHDKDHKSGFPENESGGKLKNFYENTISEMIFKKLVDKYQMERAKIGTKMCFTTKYNREQLKAGLRGYDFQTVV